LNTAKDIIAVGTTSLRTIESLYWLGTKIVRKPRISLEELFLSQWEVYEPLKEDITSLQSLVALSAWMKENKLERLITKTQIIIAPPYQLKIAKGLITNLHQPKSTLLLLVAAIAGSNWKNIYNYALDNDFRFLSYGDACLIYP
jgi:S-adenosylmethionine:tRNA ribosyltransferase-isomerase